MRALEFLLENYDQQLQSDLDNLLIAAKGNGANNIDPTMLATQLQHMGYSIDANSIVSLLQNNPNIMNVTPDDATLNNGQDQAGSDQTQDNAAKVGDMAQKATKIG